MLMVAILNWGRDLLIQPAESMTRIKRLRMLFERGEVDIIVFESNLPCMPLRLDEVTYEVPESDIIEFMQTQGFPWLTDEGKLMKNNKGRYVRNEGSRGAPA